MLLQRTLRSGVQRTLLSVALMLTTLFGVLPVITAEAAQSVPYKINFQGRLADSSGNILPDGSYNIKFRMYDAASAGTLKWTENRIITGTDNRVSVSNGLFNIQFGDLTALSPSLFSGAFPLYLEVELPTPATSTCATNGCAVFTEGPMTPRQPLASSPYAISADTIDGIDSSALAQLNTSNTGSITVTGALQSATATFTGASALTLGSTTNAAGIVFNDGTSNNRAVTLAAPALAGSYSLSLPTTAPTVSQCLLSGASTASQLIFGACSGAAGSLQSSYNVSSDPEISLSTAATAGITIRDNATAIAGNLLEVQNNARTVTYLAVSASGVSITGTGIFTGAVTAPSLDASGALAVGNNVSTTSITLGRTGVGFTVPATGVVAANFTGTPAASATGSLIQLSGAISGGSANGTYIGANPTSFSGDFYNFQVNGVLRSKLTSLGNQLAGFTLLNGSSSAVGAGTASTSLTVLNGTDFDVGNYVFINSTYAKITAKAVNILTITPALTWANLAPVTEYHVPEIGGNGDVSPILSSRYGRGYFITGIAVGNGTTIYSEDGISSSLTSYNLLNSNVTSLNIGGAATNLAIGSSSTAVAISGNLSVDGTITSSGPSSGSSGHFSRSGTSLSPSVAGDNITTSGNIFTSSTGTITSASTVTGTVINGTSSINTGAGAGTQRIDVSGNFTGGTINSAAISGGSLSNTAVNGLNVGANAISSATGALSFQAASGSDTNLQSAGAGSLNLISGSGTINVSATTIKRTGATGLTLDLMDSVATTLALTNSGGGVANLTATGTVTITGKINSATGFDRSSTGTLNIGSDTATAITLGKSGVGVSVPGGITTSNGTINTGNGSITTTGAIGGGAITGTSLTASSAGTISTTGSVSGGTTTGTSSVVSPLFDSISAGQLNIGTGTATSIAVGKAGVGVTAAGGITTSGAAVNAGSGTVTAGTVSASTVTAGTVTVSTIIQPSANNTVDLGTATASFANIFSDHIDSGTVTTAMNIGAVNAASIVIGKSTITTTIAGKLQVGSSITDATQILLQLDSFSTFADTATCTTSNNQGAIYYNTASNAVRGCINGIWEDVVTTGGLGLMLFGVVPESGSNPGDLPSLVTPGVTGPCKVSWASATSVSVAPCTAYSGGRKVVVAATTLTLTTTTTNLYANVCLTGVNGAPAMVGPAATQNSPTILPTFSTTSPILCLATVRNNTGGTLPPNGSFAAGIGGTQGQIYDTRTFTTSTKEFVTAPALAMGLGFLAQVSGAGVTTTSAVGAANQRGVVVASNGATSSTTPNVIIVTSGPAVIVANAGSVGGYVQSSATATFATTSATIDADAFANMGVSRTAFAAGCTSAATCIGSLLVNVTLR